MTNQSSISGSSIFRIARIPRGTRRQPGKNAPANMTRELVLVKRAAPRPPTRRNKVTFCLASVTYRGIKVSRKHRFARPRLRRSPSWLSLSRKQRGIYGTISVNARGRARTRATVPPSNKFENVTTMPSAGGTEETDFLALAIIEVSLQTTRQWTCDLSCTKF